MNIIRSSVRVRTLIGLLTSVAALRSTAAGAVATLYTKGLYAIPELSDKAPRSGRGVTIRISL